MAGHPLRCARRPRHRHPQSPRHRPNRPSGPTGENLLNEEPERDVVRKTFPRTFSSPESPESPLRSAPPRAMSFRRVVLLTLLACGCGAGSSTVPDAAVTPDGMPRPDAHPSDAHHVDASADASRDASKTPDARNVPDAPPHDAPGEDAPSPSCGLSGGIVCAIGATCGQPGCSVACTSATCPSGTACGPSGWCYPTSCGASAFQYCFVSATDTGMCCGGTCVDIDTDPNNCSFCNTPCSSAGLICVRGQCTSPPQDCATAAPGSPCLDDGGLGTCCGPGACRPTASFSSDSENCNGCGNICPDG
jgi:hypothetical protein